MTYYKAFNKDLTCIGYQFEIGKTFQVEGKLEMCKNGFHCCKNILNCLGYYRADSRFCEVSIGDEYISDDDKTVVKQITIDREIIGDELNELLTGVVERRVCRVKPRVVHINDGNNTTYKVWYKNGLVHRDDDLPAVIYSDTKKEWYKFGKRHREGDRPAIIYSDGHLMEWYKNGERYV